MIERGSGAFVQPGGGCRPVAPPVALYVHVPFCLSLCPYCDFVVYAGAIARGPRSRLAAYLAALGTELDLRAGALDAAFGPPAAAAPGDAAPVHGEPGRDATGRDATGPAALAAEDAGRPPLESLYLGGGTPSLLPAEAVGGIVDRVARRYGLARGAEVTLEANPGPDDRGDLAGFAGAGVNRVSFGAQSMDPAALRALGRRHAPEDVAEAVGAARAAGIREVNLDLLYDVPGQSLDRWTSTLEAAVALGPDHLSLYALTLDDPDAEGLTGPEGDHLPTPPGARRWRERARGGQDEDRAAAAYGLADALLAEAGYAWYELSNWAGPGRESRHNLAYWTRRPYEAVGPGAHAFDGATRRWNAARLNGWLGALHPPDGSAPRFPPGGSEAIDPATARAEALILGLRTAAGVAREDALTQPDALAWAAEAGLVEVAPGDRVRLTLRGRLLSNEVFARLL